MRDKKNDSDFIQQVNRDYYLAEVQGHKSDLGRAKVGRAILNVTDSPRQARLWAQRHIEGVSSQRAALLVRMGEALNVVGADLFLAVGWSGVRDLLKLDVKERERTTVKVIAAHKKVGKKLSRVSFLKITGKSTTPKPNVKPAVQSGPTERERLLAKELRRLLVLDTVRTFLSEEARAVVDELAPVEAVA